MALTMTVAYAELLPGIDASLPKPEATESLPEVESVVPQGPGLDEVLAERLEKIRVESWLKPEGFEDISERFEVQSDLVMPDPEGLAENLGDFYGRALTVADLASIGDRILIHYDRQGFPVVGVEAPEQGFEGGLLVVRVEVGRIGRVGVTRPSYGREDVIKLGLSLNEGALLRRADLDRQMDWYGRTIFRRPRLFVSPGLEPATADLLIALEERRPWRVNVGFDNSGTDLVGRERFVLGAAGMTPGGQVIGWQTVLGMPISSLHAHAVSWEIPIHRWQQSIQLDAAYAEVLTRSPGLGGFVENEGTSWSVSAGHRILLPRLAGWEQRFSSGFEIKGTDQFALFGSAAFAPGEVRFVQAKVSYGLQREWDEGSVAFGVGLIGSPGGLISGNDDADFSAYDPMADSSYVIARFDGAAWWLPGGDWRFGLRGSAQWADSRLLPAEQFAAGGYRTVRGVAEREFFADKGWQTSFEVVTPAWRPMSGVIVRGVGFLDHAWLQNRGGASSSISGTGLGLRVGISEYVEMRADHGWWIDGRGSRTHFGITMRY